MRHSSSSTAAAVHVYFAALRSIPSIAGASILTRGCNGLFRQLLDTHARHAIAIHLQHGVPPALVLHRIADARDVSEAEQQETGQCFKTGVGGNLDAEVGLQFADTG